MSKNREIEAKTLLHKNIYQQIIMDFPTKENFVQENYYFDTPTKLLKKHQISLRIRVYSDHAEQTMKVPDPNPIQKNYHEVIEINDNLSLQEARKLIALKKIDSQGNIGQYLHSHFQLEEQNLKLFTWSKTHRILLNGPKNCELTLDATSYPDNFEDYELEIENPDPILIKKIQKKLEMKYDFSQNPTNSNQSKIARATIHAK